MFGSLGVSVGILKQLNAEFRKANLTFIIDTHPRICIERMKKARHHVELFEDEQKLEQIRRNMLSLKSYFPDTYVIDGNRSAEEIMKDIMKIAEKS